MHAKTPTILSAAALAVAVLGSTPLGHAAAGMVLPINSVGTSQLKSQSVTGLKVKNHSLSAIDFKAGQLPAGPQGPKGDTGAAGAQGPSGPAGPSGISGYQRVHSNPVDVAVGQMIGSVASCPAGTKVLGGGASASHEPLAFRWIGAAGPDSYLAVAKNVGTSPDKLYVWAICASVS
jgi:hypothetical protein